MTEGKKKLKKTITSIRQKMPSVESVATQLRKGTRFMGNIVKGIREIKQGDWRSVTRGVIDILNGISTYAPPPLGQLMQSIATISGLIIG